MKIKNIENENRARAIVVIILLLVSIFSVGFYQTFLFLVGAMIAGGIAYGVLRLLKK